MHNRIVIRVWGDSALFTQPHFAADPMTAPVMGPSPAKGILRAIFHKPEFEWEILRIHIAKPILYRSFKTKAVKGTSRWTEDSARTLRVATELVDVEYFIEARIAVNTRRTTKPLARYLGEARKKMRQGKQWSVPCFGMREYLAWWELWEDEIPKAQPINMNLGSMLFDMRPVDIAKDQWNPIFWHAEIRDGVLEVPQSLYERERRTLMDARMKVSPPHPDHKHTRKVS